MKDKTINKGPRKRCKTCRYRESEYKRGCNYLLVTGHMRGCDAEECSRYEKGPKIKLEIETGKVENHGNKL